MNVAIKKLPEDPLLLKEIILSLESEKEKLTQKTAFLQEQNKLLLARLFGRSSEKQAKSDPRQLQLNLFDEAESLVDVDTDGDDEDQPSKETINVPSHNRKKRGRKPLPDYLPRVEIIHDLPESERICSIDESILVEIGREITEILDIIPARIRVERHIMIKYGCNHCHKGVKMAPRPLRPIPKALASAAMLAHVVTAKYADGLPLYRQGSILTRAGIDIPRNTLANWMIRAGQIVQPMINLFEDVLLGYDILQADETPVQVLKEDKKPATSKSYMWVRRGGPPDKSVILFDYDPSRGEHVPKTLLAGYKGYLQTDAYAGYLAVGEDPDIILLGCMAHARRYFTDVIKAL
jgi:transposase